LALIALAGCQSVETAPVMAEAEVAAAAPSSPPPLQAGRFCGTIHNTTYDIRQPAVMTVRPGPGFEGELTIGASLIGGGPFSGTREGGLCKAATSGGVVFQGACPTSSYSGAYEIQGQKGTMNLTAAGCPTG
jgi:hypothetical protein